MGEKKTIIEKTIIVGDLELIPVAELSTHCYQGEYGLYFSAFKKPIAIVVILKNDIKVLSADGSKLSLDKFLQEVPQLASLVNQHRQIPA